MTQLAVDRPSVGAAGGRTLGAMPELPDIEDYRAALDRPGGRRDPDPGPDPGHLAAEDLRPAGATPSTVGSAPRSGGSASGWCSRSPPPTARTSGRDGPDLFAVLHLMIAGRLAWAEPGAKVPGKVGPGGVRLVGDRGPATPRAGPCCCARPGPRSAPASTWSAARRGSPTTTAAASSRSRPTSTAFRAELTRERRTAQAGADRPAAVLRHRQRLQRRDPPRRPAVPGQAHRPARPTTRWPASTPRPSRCSTEWVARLREATGDGFPGKVTAFRPEFAVHGKHGEPCPVCGTAGPAHPLRRQRDQLLPALPDRRQGPRRPQPVPPAQGRLAADGRPARGRLTAGAASEPGRAAPSSGPRAPGVR